MTPACFQTLVGATQLGGVAGWLIAESSLLPYDITHEAEALQHCLTRLHEQHDQMLRQHDLSLRESLHGFLTV